MKNDSELTLFSIYNFRGQNLQMSLGNPACPWVFLAPIVCPVQVFLGISLGRERGSSGSPGGWGPGARAGGWPLSAGLGGACSSAHTVPLRVSPGPTGLY